MIKRELDVVLVETFSRGQKGSMVRYADLVAHVLCNFNHPVRIRIRRVCLTTHVFTKNVASFATDKGASYLGCLVSHDSSGW